MKRMNMIIKNEIPILEYDNSSPEVIKPNSGCEELKLPEKCVFAFLGDCVDEFAIKSNAKIAEEFENCCRITNIYVLNVINGLEYQFLKISPLTMLSLVLKY